MLINILQPKKISLQTIRDEVATCLHIASQRIERIEYWQHQIWINISGVGGRIISYRSLPAWLRQAIMAIKNCTNSEQLQELGNLIRLETQRFSQYYPEEKIQQMREIWSEKLSQLQEQEQREAPQRQHQQEAQEWLETWQKVIARCPNTACLQKVFDVMEVQSYEFEDLPTIIEELTSFYSQRLEELSKDEAEDIKQTAEGF